MDKMEYLARMRDALLHSEGTSRVGRGTPQKGKLLDDVDQNIGNGQLLPPQALIDYGGVLGANLTPDLNPPRLLALDALSPTGRMVTITLTASNASSGSTVTPLALPITGIIEFGNGSVFTRVEVDVPVGAYEFATNVREPRDGGIVVSVPSGTIRVYMRNDGAFVTPNVNGTAALNVGSATPAVPFGPTGTATPFTAFGKAFANYETKSAFSRPRKTLYLGGNTPNTSTLYSIPAFAQKVRVLRDPTVNLATYRLTFVDAAAGVGFGNILAMNDFPPATPSEFVDVPGTANTVGFSITAGVPSGPLMLEFEIGL